jgi:hypothetical protein
MGGDSIEKITPNGEQRRKLEIMNERRKNIIMTGL